MRKNKVFVLLQLVRLAHKEAEVNKYGVHKASPSFSSRQRNHDRLPTTPPVQALGSL